ncbi:DMT family transporter [Desulfovibrio sp. X2]|uniref:DMT family transporter n=1 Tax=Desulfovibrio sp. X2 TaxID=941449 RepID=UPI000556C045|nr:DMT family transporter [Desulfovibrio sp. X2]
MRANGLLLLTAAIWGAAFVAQRVGMEHIGPMAFNGIRFTLGALALLPLAARSAGTAERPLGRRGALLVSLAAGCVLFLGASLQQWGIVYTTAGKAGFITGLYVILVPLLGLWFGQRPGIGCWIGALLAVAGLYLLSVEGDFSMQWGDVLVLISALFWAVHVLLVGAVSPRMNPVRFAMAQYAVCALLSLVSAFFLEETTLSGVTAAAVPILYGGLMSVGVAYTLQVVAQRDAHPAHAAIILSLEGAFAALAGWLLLDEVIPLRGLVGCGLMLAGMLAAQADELRRPA